MPSYVLNNGLIHFKQSKMPIMLFIVLGQLGIYVHMTGNKMYPYAVGLSESEFISCIELAKEA